MILLQSLLWLPAFASVRAYDIIFYECFTTRRCATTVYNVIACPSIRSSIYPSVCPPVSHKRVLRRWL